MRFKLQGWELDYEGGIFYGASHPVHGYRRSDELSDSTRSIEAAWELWREMATQDDVYSIAGIVLSEIGTASRCPTDIASVVLMLDLDE